MWLTQLFLLTKTMIISRDWSHAQLWLVEYRRSDWPGARGHFAPVFQNQTAFSTAICISLGAFSSSLSFLSSHLYHGCSRAGPVALHRRVGAYFQIDQGEFPRVASVRWTRRPHVCPFRAGGLDLLIEWCANESLQQYQAYLDACTPYTTYRWVGSGVLLFIFFLRIVLAQGWYIGMFDQCGGAGGVLRWEMIQSSIRDNNVD